MKKFYILTCFSLSYFLLPIMVYADTPRIYILQEHPDFHTWQTVHPKAMAALNRFITLYSWSSWAKPAYKAILINFVESPKGIATLELLKERYTDFLHGILHEVAIHQEKSLYAFLQEAAADNPTHKELLEKYALLEHKKSCEEKSDQGGI